MSISGMTEGGAHTTDAEAIALTAPDGFTLSAHHWHAETTPQPQAIAIINCATAVKAEYYHRYAKFLTQHGIAVLTYDYRGVGGSRPSSLRGFHVSKGDWGRLDFEAALLWAKRTYPDTPLWVVGHSIGGFVPGLAPSSHLIDRMFTVGAQYAYWRDYAPEQRLKLLCKYHLAMPTLATLLGYLPAKRLGWMEDLPKGAAMEWATRRARFEDSYRRDAEFSEHEVDDVLNSFRAVRAPILAMSLTDDAFGTVSAIHRLLHYYEYSSRQHIRIAPADIGVQKIGHFAFFHERFRDTLWQDSLLWLRDGVVSYPVFSAFSAGS